MAPWPPNKVGEFCRRYEEQIAEAGGIDIQLLGIGRTGHVGFNEPGSNRNSRARLITLDKITRCDAASDFFGEEHVPRHAITLGVGNILEARHLDSAGVRRTQSRDYCQGRRR